MCSMLLARHVFSNISTVQLNTPADFALTVNSPSQITVSWTDNNTFPNEEDYELLVDKVSTFDSYDLQTINPVQDASSYAVTALDYGTLYYMKLKAIGDGSFSLDSDYTSTLSKYTDAIRDFFTGMTRDTAVWTDTDNSATTQIIQSGNLILEGDGSVLVTPPDLNVSSQGKRELTTGSLQMTFSASATTYNSNARFRMQFPDTGGGANHILIGKASGTTTDMQIAIVENGTTIYSDSSVASFGSVAASKILRIGYDGTNAYIDLWNGSAWINEVTQNAPNLNSGGDGWALLEGGNNTGGDTKQVIFDNLVFSPQVNYTTNVPT